MSERQTQPDYRVTVREPYSKDEDFEAWMDSAAPVSVPLVGSSAPGYSEEWVRKAFDAGAMVTAEAKDAEIKRLREINSDKVEKWNFYLIRSARLEDRLKLIERYVRECHEREGRADTDTILNDFIEATDDEIAAQLFGEMSTNG